MRLNEKAAGCGDTQAAQQTVFSIKCNQKLAVLKGYCFRLAAWLSTVGGGLC
jgi:hypothetical protein